MRKQSSAPRGTGLVFCTSASKFRFCPERPQCSFRLGKRLRTRLVEPVVVAGRGSDPSPGASEGLASLSRRCPSPETRTFCGGLRPPLPRSLQNSAAPPPLPTRAGGARRREQPLCVQQEAPNSGKARNPRASTWPAALGDRRAAVPPTALLLTNETGPRPPRSADFTSGPAPAGLRRQALQLSLTAWS